MGLFSSDYKYYAYASTSPLFDEDARPDTFKSLILQAVIGNFSSSDAIILALHTNMYARARSMIKYAVREYVRGLPETTQPSIFIEQSDIAAAIERDVGEPIDLIIGRWGGFRDAFFVEEALDANYMNSMYFPWTAGDPLETDWERTAFQVEIPVLDPSATAPPDSPYYMTDPQDYDFDRTTPEGDYRVTYNYLDELGNPATWVIPATFALPKSLSNQWVVARYELESDPGVTRYWSYEIGSDVDYYFESAIQASSINMTYLPVAILMHDKVWWDDEYPEDDDPLEHTTHRLLKRLAVDSYEVKEQFLEQQAEDDADDDIEKSNAEVWDFFIHFTVPIRSKIRGSREYMWNFWKFIEDNGTWTDYDQYQAFLAGGAVGVQPSSNFHITEGHAETAYHLYYAWSYIHEEIKPGRYEVNGVPLMARRMHSHIYEYGTAGYKDGIEEVHGVGTPIATHAMEQHDLRYHDYAVFTRQLYDTATGEYSYSQVLVMAPSMMYVINTSEEGDYRQQYVNVELFPEDPELNSEFRLPIHIGSLKATSVMHREELLADALCATVFLVQEQKVKWYQQTFFKWLIIIIVVILVVLFWYTGVMPAIAAAAGAAVGGAAAIGWWMLYVLLSFAMGFLISFAGALIGGTGGKIFVIVGMIMMKGENPFSNLAGSWANLAANAGWGTATTFIMAIQPFINFGMMIIQDISTASMESELRDFLKDNREKQQELQDAWDSLGDPPGWLDPMDLIRVQAVTVLESPSDYIERSLMTNPGVLGYDLITNFSDIALMLPDGEGDMIHSMLETMAQQRGAA